MPTFYFNSVNNTNIDFGNHQTVNNLNYKNNQKPETNDKCLTDLIQQIKDLKQLISESIKFANPNDLILISLLKDFQNDRNDNKSNRNNQNQNNKNQDNQNYNKYNIHDNQDDQSDNRHSKNNINNMYDNQEDQSNNKYNNNNNQYDQYDNRNNNRNNNRRKRSIVAWIPSLASLAFNVVWSVMSMSLAFASIILYSLITWLGFGPLFPPFLFMVVNYAPFLIPSLSQISSFVGGVMTLI